MKEPKKGISEPKKGKNEPKKAVKEPKLKTNLDTNLLKLIAIVAMSVDHVGAEFFPAYPVFRWIGRIAFPIFCYCLTVGMLYTRDIRKYALRLAVFALVSQPFWILAFNADDFWGNLTNMNIFFTLLVSLLAAWGAKEKKWWLLGAGILLLCLFNFDYSITGLVLMLIFYYCRKKPWLMALLYILSYLPLGSGALDDPLALKLGNYALDFSIFSLFALPLILIPMYSRLRIPKWFFYVYYPAHLLVIYLLHWI